MTWVPRELNIEADLESRVVDYHYWGIREEIFRICVAKWGVTVADMFADGRNAKC